MGVHMVVMVVGVGVGADVGAYGGDGGRWVGGWVGGGARDEREASGCQGQASGAAHVLC